MALINVFSNLHVSVLVSRVVCDPCQHMHCFLTKIRIILHISLILDSPSYTICTHTPCLCGSLQVARELHVTHTDTLSCSHVALSRKLGMEAVPFGRSVLCVSLVWVMVMVMVCTMVTVVSCEDLYRVLGVPRSASVKEIRRAHKTLAKEW